MLHVTSAMLRARSTARSGRWLAALLVILLSVALLPGPGRMASAALAPPPPSVRPFVPLWTWAPDVRQVQTVNGLPPAQLDAFLDNLQNWYRHVHYEGSNTFGLGYGGIGTSSTTLARKLTARGIRTSQYRNGSYTSQGMRDEGPLLERQAPLAMATHWPGAPGSTAGTITSALKTGETVVSVRTSFAQRPAGLPARTVPEQWPWRPSRGAGLNSGDVYSQNVRDFVSWVRIDNEIMRIRRVEHSGTGPAATVRLTVDRGYFGTTPAAHAGNTKAMSPVYIGVVSAARQDKTLAGSPAVYDFDPTAAERPLRYTLNIWQDDAQQWIARRIVDTFGARRGVKQPAPDLGGYDTIWWDVSGSSTFNTADAYGSDAEPWDHPHGTRVTGTTWMDYQIRKTQGVMAKLRAMGYPQRIYNYANNFAGSARGAEREAMNKRQQDGFVHEFWLGRPQGHGSQFTQLFDNMANNHAAIYWVKDVHADAPRLGWRDRNHYRRFTYGSLLLAYRPTATSFQYGLRWGFERPDPWLFYHLGPPQGAPTSLANVSVKAGAATVYRRNYANGVALVNPSRTKPVTVNVGSGYWNVTATPPRQVSGSVTIPPMDAAVLYRR